MRVFWRWVLVCTILVLGSESSFTDRQHSREAAGLLSAFHANMLGIDSYEVVVVLSESGLKPDESLYESQRTFILMADYPHDR